MNMATGIREEEGEYPDEGDAIIHQDIIAAHPCDQDRRDDEDNRADDPRDDEGENQPGAQGVIGGLQVAFTEFHADNALAADTGDDGERDQKPVDRDDEVDRRHRVGADKIADQNTVDKNLGRQQKERQHARYDEFDEELRDTACCKFLFSPGFCPGLLFHLFHFNLMLSGVYKSSSVAIGLCTANPAGMAAATKQNAVNLKLRF